MPLDQKRGHKNNFSNYMIVYTYVPPKRRLIFNGLHDVISEKLVLFINTALRTSNYSFADHSPASSAEVMKGGTIPPLPHMS
jgi:hypothetical protein